MTQIYLKTYRRLHVYDIETEKVEIFTGNLSDSITIREDENRLAPINTWCENFVCIFGVKGALAVNYRVSVGMRINVYRSSTLIKHLFQNEVSADNPYITDIDFIRKLQGILKYSSKYYRFVGSTSVVGNGQQFFNLASKEDIRSTNMGYNYDQIKNPFCNYMRSNLVNRWLESISGALDNLHFRNFMTWYVLEGNNPEDLEVVKTCLGMYYIKSQRGVDPFQGIQNKYDFVSAIVGYKVRKGISPELRTEEDAKVVIERLNCR